MKDHPNHKWWTLFAMCFALFMIMLDNTVVNVALPSIQRDLHASISGLEWTINGYTLSFAVLLATGGRLGDIFGRRRMFVGGVIVFAASSALIGLAPSQTLLVAGRAVPQALNDARLSALQELMSSLVNEEADALAHALGLILKRRDDIAAYRPSIDK